MNRIVLIVVTLLLLLPSSIHAQVNSSDTTSYSQDSIPRQGNGYVFWFVPSPKDHIFGIAIGFFGSEIICNVPNVKKSHGINIQLIGQGLFIPINPKAFRYKSMFASDTCLGVVQKDNKKYRAVHNGILFSTFGTMTNVSNGLVVSGWFSLGDRANGVICNALSNKYTVMNGLAISVCNASYEANGLQIGFVNRTRKLRGFQFGFWNVNDKRKLPLINWCFKP